MRWASEWIRMVEWTKGIGWKVYYVFFFIKIILLDNFIGFSFSLLQKKNIWIRWKLIPFTFSQKKKMNKSKATFFSLFKRKTKCFVEFNINDALIIQSNAKYRELDWIVRLKIADELRLNIYKVRLQFFFGNMKMPFRWNVTDTFIYPWFCILWFISCMW